MNKQHITIFVAVISIMLFMQILYFNFTLDDVLISLKYAENIANGNGYVWNVGQKIGASTNFVLPLVQALMFKVGLDMEVGTKLLGILLSIFCLILIYLITREFLSEEEKNWAILPVILLGLMPSFAIWSVSAMGAVVFMAILLLATYLFIKEERGNWIYTSGLVFGILAVTRPEGVAFFGISLLFRVYKVVKKDLRFTKLLIWCITFLIPYIGHLVWRYFYYEGNTFVTTITAKFLMLGGTGYLSNYLLYITPFMIFAWIGVAVNRNELKTYMFGMFLALFFVVVNLYPLSGLFFRFILPATPFLFVLTTLGIKEITKNKPKVMIVIIILLLATFLLNPVVIKEQNKYVEKHMASQAEMIVLGKWLAEHYEPTDLLATEYGGGLPYYSKMKTLDLFGYLDNYIAEHGLKRSYIVDTRKPKVFVFDTLYLTSPYESTPGMRDINLLYLEEDFLMNYTFVGEWKYGENKLVVYERNE